MDDLRGSEIAALLDEHLQNMYLITPPESVHALDIEASRKPEITFWSAWEDTDLCGCGALKQLSSDNSNTNISMIFELDWNIYRQIKKTEQQV